MECFDKNLIHEYSMALWLYSGSRVIVACDLQPWIYYIFRMMKEFGNVEEEENEK